MSKTRECQLIGGPADGLVLGIVDKVREVRVPLPQSEARLFDPSTAPSEVQIASYRRCWRRRNRFHFTHMEG